MATLFAHPRFLATYCGVLTLAFFASSVYIAASIHTASAAQQYPSARFNQLTVRRINIVEPDGTLRMTISSKADYPGSYFQSKEVKRPDRNDSAGMLFLADDGTENGGLIFSGSRDKEGTVHSAGHLSFDEYAQDQTLALDQAQDGPERTSRIQLNDNGPTLMTPEIMNTFERLHALPDSPAKNTALTAFLKRNPIMLNPRASLGREKDRSSTLRLRDPEGRTRILLRVAADGSPLMQFLDASGNVAHQWPEASQP